MTLLKRIILAFVLICATAAPLQAVSPMDITPEHAQKSQETICKQIMTECGKLVIQHTTDELRKKEILPCVFHANGTPKSIPLEKQNGNRNSSGHHSGGTRHIPMQTAW